MAKDDSTVDARLIPCARAKFDFEAKSEVELGFRAGVSIRLLRRIDDNWLEGELEGKVGIFPAAYVDIELSIPSEARENELAQSGRPYAIGLFEFAGDCGGDLPFAKGELIELLGSVGSGWMRGKTGKGEGIFPSSFVEVMKFPVSPNSGASPTSPPPSPVYAYPSESDRSSRRSPEYALPGEIHVRGTWADSNGKGVLENGLSDEGGGEGDEQTYRKSRTDLRPGGEGEVASESEVVGGTEEVSVPKRTPPAPPGEPGTPSTRQVPCSPHEYCLCTSMSVQDLVQFSTAGVLLTVCILSTVSLTAAPRYLVQSHAV